MRNETGPRRRPLSPSPREPGRQHCGPAVREASRGRCESQETGRDRGAAPRTHRESRARRSRGRSGGSDQPEQEARARTTPVTKDRSDGAKRPSSSASFLHRHLPACRLLPRAGRREGPSTRRASGTHLVRACARVFLVANVSPSKSQRVTGWPRSSRHGDASHIDLPSASLSV